MDKVLESTYVVELGSTKIVNSSVGSYPKDSKFFLSYEAKSFSNILSKKPYETNIVTLQKILQFKGKCLCFFLLQIQGNIKLKRAIHPNSSLKLIELTSFR